MGRRRALDVEASWKGEADLARQIARAPHPTWHSCNRVARWFGGQGWANSSLRGDADLVRRDAGVERIGGHRLGAAGLVFR